MPAVTDFLQLLGDWPEWPVARAGLERMAQPELDALYRRVLDRNSQAYREGRRSSGAERPRVPPAASAAPELPPRPEAAAVRPGRKKAAKKRRRRALR